MKILIDNEEVVSGKDFTITEEMLNTPSVILNNVYPKAWENDKDYISRFYYPKDYSKCLIFDNESYPALEGEIVQGINLSINYNNTLNYDYKFYGNTEQGETVTGLQTIDINGTDYEINLGKNLLPNTNTTQVLNNITFTKNDDDSIKMNGTANANTPYRINTLGNELSLPAGTYTISTGNNLTSGIILQGWHSTATNFVTIKSSSNKASFTLNRDVSNVRFQIVIANGTQISNLTIYLMLEKGSQATTYSKYFTPIELETDDYIYKDNGWYISKNGVATEITNETLISQLESIELVNGTNTIISSSYNLPIILYFHYNWRKAYEVENLLFCGVVKNSGKISLNPRYPHFCDLQILDFKMFLSEVILDFVIANKTIEEAIQQVTSFISSYGFVVGNIELNNPNEMIGVYSTKDKSPYDVFNYIADITQSRWTTRMVDQNTVAIDFYNPELMEQGTAIEYTTQWFEDNKIDDISYSYGTYDYRNKQIMTSDEVMANITSSETIIANGYQTQYNTEEKIGKISSIKINGSEVTFTTNTNKELGITAEVYYNPGNQYFETDEPLSTGSVISIEYIAIVKGRQIILNSTEINRVANSTGRNGTLARYENRNDATTSDELQKIGQSYIKYKGTPEIKLNISTRNNIWEIGQKVEFNAPITELSTEYMVKRKDVKYIATIDTIFYTYELTSSFNSEREINYFDNQRAKANGNIGKGEYVHRNIDIENTTNIIFYDSSIEEVEVVGNNILDSVLDSPLNN